MRVLMVTLPLPTSAAPNSMSPLLHQINSLRALGIEIGVCEVVGTRKLKYALAAPGFRAKAPAYDLIHAHFGHCGWLARSQFRRPVVVSFMGSDLLGTPRAGGHVPWLSRLVVRANKRLARLVQGVIVKSEEMARVVASVQAHVIPNGVDLQLFQPMDPAEARAALGFDPHKRYVLFPGHPLNPRKAFPVAQAAVAIAAQRAGEDIELVTLYPTPPDKVPLVMNACDVELLTSYIEGSPNVVKEAMACNLPVVTVNTGDVAELLAGVEGCRICPRTPEALAEGVLALLAEGERSNGREMLQRKRLDLASVAERIRGVYEGVLNGR